MYFQTGPADLSKTAVHMHQLSQCSFFTSVPAGARPAQVDIHLPKEVKQSLRKCYCQKWNFPLAIYRIVSLQVQVYLHYPRNNMYKVT